MNREHFAAQIVPAAFHYEIDGEAEKNKSWYAWKKKNGYRRLGKYRWLETHGRCAWKLLSGPPSMFPLLFDYQ